MKFTFTIFAIVLLLLPLITVATSLDSDDELTDDFDDTPFDRQLRRKRTCTAGCNKRQNCKGKCKRRKNKRNRTKCNKNCNKLPVCDGECEQNKELQACVKECVDHEELNCQSDCATGDDECRADCDEIRDNNQAEAEVCRAECLAELEE